MNDCFVINQQEFFKTLTSRNFRRQMQNIIENIPIKFEDDSRRCVAKTMFSFQKLSIKDGVIDFGTP